MTFIPEQPGSNPEENESVVGRQVSHYHDTLAQESFEQWEEHEDLAAVARCLALLGWCYFKQQRWLEAGDACVCALALFAHLQEVVGDEQGRSQEDQWCEAQALMTLGAMRLRFGPTSQHTLEGILCLQRADEIAAQLGDLALLNDVRQAQRVSRRVRRPRVEP